MSNEAKASSRKEIIIEIDKGWKNIQGMERKLQELERQYKSAND